MFVLQQVVCAPTVAGEVRKSEKSELKKSFGVCACMSACVHQPE